MKREKQYDMFDVATGTCSLDDYLFQRYSENDLSSTFWVDEKDEVDELRPPEPQENGLPGTEVVVIPIQGPRAKKTLDNPKKLPLPEGLKPDSPKETDKPTSSPNELSAQDGRDSIGLAGAPSTSPSLETFSSTDNVTLPSKESFQSASQSQQDSPSMESVKLTEPESADSAPSMEALLAKFHQATKAYEERIEPSTSEEPPSE